MKLEQLYVVLHVQQCVYQVALAVLRMVQLSSLMQRLEGFHLRQGRLIVPKTKYKEDVFMNEVGETRGVLCYVICAAGCLACVADGAVVIVDSITGGMALTANANK